MSQIKLILLVFGACFLLLLLLRRPVTIINIIIQSNQCPLLAYLILKQRPRLKLQLLLLCKLQFNKTRLLVNRIRKHQKLLLFQKLLLLEYCLIIEASRNENNLLDVSLSLKDLMFYWHSNMLILAPG